MKKINFGGILAVLLLYCSSILFAANWEVQSRIDDYLVDICSDGAGHLWAVGGKGTVLTYFGPKLVSVVPANMKLAVWGNIKRSAE